MADPWQTPYYQYGHVSAADGPGPAGPAAGVQAPSQAEPLAEGCPCPLCSRTRHNDTHVWRIMAQQNPLPLGDPTAGVNNPMAIVPNVMDQAPAQFGVPQAPENAGYAPLREVEGPPRAQTIAGLSQPQVSNAPVTESLRRLAGRYVNDPESLVNAVHLEPGPSGRFRVVITLDIDGIL